MPKNIVICCDGTGNQYGKENSNLVKLYKVLVRESGRQVAYYHPGVGTMGSRNALTWIAKKWTGFKGLSFGYGLSDNIADAYQFLMHVYEAGDRIYIFGFSRGAYTARALCGLLQFVGLLSPGNEGLIPYAIRLFKSKDTKNKAKNKFRIAAGLQKTFGVPCKPHFLGVWDTVSSVGWIFDPFAHWHLPYTAALTEVAIVRHAVSIDERRAFFRQNLINHLDGDRKEVWFAGVHSDVGGSYRESESGLSKIAFQWIVRQAVNCGEDEPGLLIADHEMSRVLGGDLHYTRPQINALKHNSLKPYWWPAEFWPKRRGMNLFRRRAIPEAARFHESVIKRRQEVPKYRPKNVPSDIPQTQIERDPAVAPPFVAYGSVSLQVGEKFKTPVDSAARWNVTSLRLVKGQRYRLEASGTWYDASIACGPQGYKNPPGSMTSFFFRLVRWLRRAPKANWFALVGVVDKDSSTAVVLHADDEAQGNHAMAEFTVTKDGFLNCFANDLNLFYFNNWGVLPLTVTRLQ
jgi:hypothetical protein